MSSKESPSAESHLVPSSSRSTLLNDESISRDYSLASLTSAGSGNQQEEYFQCPDHAETTLRNMQTYLDNRSLCDVVLIAGVDSKR